ncbi:MAG: IS1182 family transposase [Muribaculaceae bacterium]|nr:IS1182 family transposase [Muribaculaceae bacterium]
MAKIPFIPHTSNEMLLFPPNLGDFIEEDSPVRLFNDVLGQVDIKELRETYHNWFGGRPAFDPMMLLKVVVYGYFNEIYSTRALERALRRDAHLIWLSGYQFPDHTTISRFKARCSGSIKKIFSSLVSILVREGYVSLAEDLYIDGTTIRSRAAKRKIKWRNAARNFSAMADEKINKAVQTLLEYIDAGDRDELVEEGRASYTPEAARELAEAVEKSMAKGDQRLRGKINAVLDACDAKEAHEKTIELCHGRCGIAPADPDSGIIHAKEDGYNAKPTPNYNVQIATQNQYVTNYGVYNTSSDKTVAVNFVETCISENGIKPRAVVADAGYGCEEVYVSLERIDVEAVVKYNNFDKEVSRRLSKKNGAFNRYGFILTSSQNNLVCPAGHRMKIVGISKTFTEHGFPCEITKFTCSRHKNCALKDKCPVAKNKNKTTSHSLESMRQEAKARKRLLQPQNQARLRRRNIEPEAVFGQLKHNHGYRKFRHFGKSNVTTDLGLMFMALNLSKLYKNIQKAR